MLGRSSRREFLRLAGLGLTGAALTACVVPTEAPAAPGAVGAPAAPVQATEELAFWIHSEEWGEYIQKEANDAGLGFTVKWELGEYDSNTKTMLALAAGTPPSISLLGRWQHPDLAARNAIVDLEDYVEMSASFKWENLWQRLQNEALFRGRKFVIPYTTDTRALFYNREVMAEAGLDPDAPPTTWEDLHSQAVAVLKQDEAGRIDRIGFTPTFGNPPVFVLFFTLYWCTGQSEVSEDRTRATIATPEGEQIMAFIKGLMDDQGGYEAAGAFTRSLTLAEGIDAFSSGHVAFAMNTNGVPRNYARYSPDLDYGMIPGPAFEAYGIPANYDGGGGWYFFKEGPNVETAFKFADYVLAREFMTKFMDNFNAMPARSDSGEEWAQLNETHRRIFVDTAETVRWPAIVPFYLELYGALATMWDNVLIGGREIASELQIAQDAMQVILDKGAEIQLT